MSGGWSRRLSLKEDGAEEEEEVRYNLHEFGAMEHDFSYWPGLSLNPGLWDLSLIQCALSTTTGQQPSPEQQEQAAMMFDPQDPRFEQSWSLRGYDAGLRVAHLPLNVFEHAGTDVSAYVMNGQHRPWDPPPAAAATATAAAA